jgi:hypothetical protein
MTILITMLKNRFFFSITILLIISVDAFSSIDDYIYPYSSSSYNEYGSLGLIRMPSARFHEEGTIAFHWSQNDPYTRGSIIAYPFDWFEASYQYTDVNNALYSNVESFSGKQTYKDKGFDVKFRLVQEREYFPQVALGIRDIAGTGTFAAEYLVASKQIKIPKYLNGYNYLTKVDLTIGLGWGDLSYSKFNNPLEKLDSSFERRTLIQDSQGGEFSPGRYFSGPMGAFAGIEIPLPNLNGLKVKIEYDGTDYSEEGFPFGRKSFQLAFESIKQSQSRINYGLTYPVNNYIQVYGAFTKGNTLSFGFTLSAGFGKKNPVIKSTDKLKSVDNPILRKELADGDDETLMILAMDVLRKNDIHVSKGSRNGEVLTVAYAQNKYMSHAMVSGRTAQALDQVSPDYIKTFTLETMNAGAVMNSISIDRETFNKYKKDKLYKLAKNDIEINSSKYNEDDYTFNPPFSYPYVFWRLEPDIVAQIGGPDGFFFGNARLAGHAEFKFSRKISINTEASIGIYDNFDELKLASDSVLPHVRTDIVKYLKETRDYSINRLQMNYFLNPWNDLYAKVSGGLLEDMFGGIGGEVLYRPMHKNFAIGAEVWSVRQRDYNMNFSFLDYTTDTGHINLYYREPLSKVTFAVKGGRFLAGDSGVNIDFSRRFKSGLRIGAFFSLTDISKEEFGEGSFDKGFYFNLPMQAFFTNYSRSLAGWGLKPLTRDGAAYVVHSHHLWGITETAQAYSIERDWDDLYD